MGRYAWRSTGFFGSMRNRLIVAAVAGLVYWLMPVDIVADATPFIGVMDDVAVGAVLALWALKA